MRLKSQLLKGEQDWRLKLLLRRLPEKTPKERLKFKPKLSPEEPKNWLLRGKLLLMPSSNLRESKKRNLSGDPRLKLIWLLRESKEKKL